MTRSISQRAKFHIVAPTRIRSYILVHVNHFWLYDIFMKFCGDIEENPGPKPSSNQNFSICHWNLNSISVHNYIKLSFLRAYLSTYKFDLVSISETYLDSDTSNKDANLETTD